jgi:hypothetical protein
MLTTKLPIDIETKLAQLEAQFEAVVAAVNSGDPEQLEKAGLTIRQAAVDFSGMMQSVPADLAATKQIKPRLKKIANALAVQRVNLIRRSVVVDRTLQAMVPAAVDDAYKPGASGPYASALKQSGAFKLLAA